MRGGHNKKSLAQQPLYLFAHEDARRLPPMLGQGVQLRQVCWLKTDGEACRVSVHGTIMQYA